MPCDNNDYDDNQNRNNGVELSSPCLHLSYNLFAYHVIHFRRLLLFLGSLLRRTK